MSRVVAAFDFDGTLTTRDSLLPFVASVVGWPKVGRAFTSSAPQFARRDRDAAKEKFLAAAVGGMSYDALRAAGASFARSIVITPEMQRRVHWHQREGHDIVIVSASLDVYLVDAASRIGITDVLCSSLEVDDGRVTGRLVGGNCRGPEKAKRLSEFLGDADTTLWAYGDSSGDNEMLALASRPMRVKRGHLR
jgi:HAD superfamily hydrolase (TIGR01490 family)